MTKRVKIICTIGPASSDSKILSLLKEKKVDFFRINLSHTNENDILDKINLLKPYNVPLIIDTEGPQVRTGNTEEIKFKKGNLVKVYSNVITCNSHQLFLTPSRVVNSFEAGDKISLAFGSAIFKVESISSLEKEGYVECSVLSEGIIGSKKAVHIESPNFLLSDFSEKDMKAIEIAKKNNIKHFTLSFMENADSVKRIRDFYPEAILYSKIESKKGLTNFDAIVDVSDGILIDRGDLSSQIPIQKIPIVQKHLIEKCRKKGKEIFIATDTLQNMFSDLRPNAADANDMVNTLLDGATGIALTKETAVGKYPLETVDMMNKIINQVETIKKFENIHHPDVLRDILENGEF